MQRLTERIDVRVTADEKERITAAARAVGISTGEYLRRSAAGYSAPLDEAAIRATLCQLDESSQRASEAIDGTLAWIEASNGRIAEMEQAAVARDQ
jgi:uncharacterized protein (DUF1778 family)